MIRIVVVCTALSALLQPVAAQHEHHGVPVRVDSLNVRAERDAVRLRSGATVVDVDASAAAGGSVADLLRTVPGVEIDADGHITLRGNSGVLVLMNGRRATLAGAALVALLRQMPATALERIEAGSTISAQHGADGAAGVVNLVFRDDAARGVARHSLAASVATDDHYMGSAAAAGDVRDVFAWDAMYALSAVRPRSATTTERWSIVPGDLPLTTQQASRARESHRLHSVHAGVSVVPSANTSLALRGAYSWMEGAYRNSSAFVYTNSAGDTDSSHTASLLEHEIPSGELGITAAYDPGWMRFAIEARTSFVNEDLRGDYRDADAGYSYMGTAMTSRQHERGVRNDIALRASAIRLEAGHESRFRTVSAAHDLTHFNATASQSFRYESAVHAGYLTASRVVAGVRAQAGLRVEVDRTRIRPDTISVTQDTRIFPNVSAEWSDASRGDVYRLAYGRRTNRPGPEMLNPFSMGGDDMNEITGNPSLSPEVSDQVELGVERHHTRVTLQLTPFLRWTRDPIRQIKASTPRGGASTTLANLDRSRALGVDGSVRARPADRMTVTLAGSLAHMETTDERFGSNGMEGSARLTLDVEVDRNTTAQLYAYRRSAMTIEQGEIRPVFTSDLSLTRRLARERGRLTLRVSDPLRSDRLAFRVAGADFTQASRRRTERPLLSLFASWAVGGAPREDAPARPQGPARIF